MNQRKRANLKLPASKNNEDKDESIIEAFQCFICMGKLENAHLCPHCSKLCCYKCITRWLTEREHKCPHCRIILHTPDLVNCRWFEEVSIHVEGMKEQFAKELLIKKKAQCDMHKDEKLSVYCETCNTSICHLCALFDGGHNGHKFQKLDIVYERYRKELNNQAKKLKHHMIKLEDSSKYVMTNIDDVRKAQVERINDIRTTMEAIVAKLEDEMKTKMIKLICDKTKLLTETAKVKRLLLDVDNEIGNSTQPQFIKNSQDLLKKMEKQSRLIPFSLNKDPVSCDYTTDIVPGYDKGKYTIKNFSKYKKSDQAIYSVPLNAYGPTWRLKVYPQGNGVVRGEYLSVFMELTEGCPGSSRYEYRIALNHPLKEKIIIRQFVSDFVVGECWGYSKFFRLDAIRQNGYLLNDCLELEFEVRACTYIDKCRYQQWKIDSLLKSKLEQEMELQVMNEQMEMTYSAAMEVESRLRKERRDPGIKRVNSTSIEECTKTTIKNILNIARIEADGQKRSGSLNNTNDEFINNVNVDNSIQMGKNLKRLYERRAIRNRLSQLAMYSVSASELENIKNHEIISINEKKICNCGISESTLLNIAYSHFVNYHF